MPTGEFLVLLLLPLEIYFGHILSQNSALFEKHHIMGCTGGKKYS